MSAQTPVPVPDCDLAHDHSRGLGLACARLRAWLRLYGASATFGLFDGLTVVLGVLLSLGGHPALVLPAAAGVAAAEGVGMAAGEWLSESDAGFGGALMIGGTTALGSILPALPYAFLGPHDAMRASLVILAGLTGTIGALRVPKRGWRRAFVETVGVLLIVVAAVALVRQIAPPAP